MIQGELRRQLSVVNLRSSRLRWRACWTDCTSVPHRVWGGREAETQEGGAEGEGGGEDEGVAFRKPTEGEEPTSAWENFASTLIELMIKKKKGKELT